MMPLPALAFGKIASAIGWRGFVAIGLVVALGVQTWRLSSAHSEIEDQRNALATEVAQHAVTRSSLAALESELGKMVRDGELRAERLVEAMEAQDERSAALRAQAARVRSEGGVDACVTPDAVRNAGGL